MTTPAPSRLGALALRWYYKPLNRLRDCVREGGPWQQRKTRCGALAMEEAARRLPSPGAAIGPALEVHLLTGRRFWHQTAFCLWSFARHTGRVLRPVIYDDGTLTDEFRAPLARIFPRVRFVGQTDTFAQLDAHLPLSRFPMLRERWGNYPNIRKLIDPHVGRTGWKLVLDSDLLFFRTPNLLVDWLDAPGRPLHAVDCETSYGYSPALMGELAGAPIADRVNVGLTGLNGAELDWEKLEHWCRVLLEREGVSYYLEQALIAMLVAGRSCAVAPAGDYITRPSSTEADACTAVMHHYVATSKRWYFQSNWRRALARTGSVPAKQ